MNYFANFLQPQQIGVSVRFAAAAAKVFLLFAAAMTDGVVILPSLLANRRPASPVAPDC
jgi:hypothetical protein